MKVVLNNHEREVTGLGEALINLFIVVPLTAMITLVALLGTFLVTAGVFLFVLLILFSPIILIGLVIAWLT